MSLLLCGGLERGWVADWDSLPRGYMSWLKEAITENTMLQRPVQKGLSKIAATSTLEVCLML